MQWLHELGTVLHYKEFPLLKTGLLEHFNKITPELLLILLVVRRKVNTKKLQDRSIFFVILCKVIRYHVFLYIALIMNLLALS